MGWPKCGIGLLLAGLVGCEPPPNHGKLVELVSAAPQHSTRAYLTWKFEDGAVEVISSHRSWEVSCGSHRVHVYDFLNGQLPFGELHWDCR